MNKIVKNFNGVLCKEGRRISHKKACSADVEGGEDNADIRAYQLLFCWACAVSSRALSVGNEEEKGLFALYHKQCFRTCLRTGIYRDAKRGSVVVADLRGRGCGRSFSSLRFQSFHYRFVTFEVLSDNILQFYKTKKPPLSDGSYFDLSALSKHVSDKLYNLVYRVAVHKESSYGFCLCVVDKEFEHFEAFGKLDNDERYDESEESSFDCAYDTAEDSACRSGKFTQEYSFEKTEYYRENDPYSDKADSVDYELFGSLVLYKGQDVCEVRGDKSYRKSGTENYPCDFYKSEKFHSEASEKAGNQSENHKRYQYERKVRYRKLRKFVGKIDISAQNHNIYPPYSVARAIGSIRFRSGFYANITD